MFVVDTNILIYGANADAPEHETWWDLLDAWRRQNTPWYISWGIAYEFLRVATHPRILPAPLRIADAWNFLEALMASPSMGFLLPTDQHANVAAQVVRDLPFLSGNLLLDTRTAVLMREHGLRTIYTHDADFFRFHFLEVKDPLAARL